MSKVVNLDDPKVQLIQTIRSTKNCSVNEAKCDANRYLALIKSMMK